MKIIISPAKKMNIRTDEPVEFTEPVYLKKAECLWNTLKEKDFQTLQKLWKCNEKIARQNWYRLQNQNFSSRLTPAVLAYEGIQYQYMAPSVFTENQWEYAQKNLRILSGLYGILRPMDGVIPYRLEMQTRLETVSNSRKKRDLYDFWEEDIYRELVKEERIILNLASKEYSKTVAPYVREDVRYITCIFGEWAEGRVKVKGTQAKIARGEMVRWLSENQIEEVEKVKEFQRLGYRYEPVHSTASEMVFIKEKEGLQK